MKGFTITLLSSLFEKGTFFEPAAELRATSGAPARRAVLKSIPPALEYPRTLII